MNSQYHIESIVHHLYELTKIDDSKQAFDLLDTAITAAKALYDLPNKKKVKGVKR